MATKGDEVCANTRLTITCSSSESTAPGVRVRGADGSIDPEIRLWRRSLGHQFIDYTAIRNMLKGVNGRKERRRQRRCVDLVARLVAFGQPAASLTKATGMTSKSNLCGRPARPDRSLSHSSLPTRELGYTCIRPCSLQIETRSANMLTKQFSVKLSEHDQTTSAAKPALAPSASLVWK